MDAGAIIGRDGGEEGRWDGVSFSRSFFPNEAFFVVGRRMESSFSFGGGGVEGDGEREGSGEGTTRNGGHIHTGGLAPLAGRSGLLLPLGAVRVVAVGRVEAEAEAEGEEGGAGGTSGSEVAAAVGGGGGVTGTGEEGE